MAASSCSLCNTALVDNLICCTGRCHSFFHYTCVGFTRTFMESYKKVSGLKWQCSNCIDDYNRLWTKLDELSSTVNEIKSSINTYGLVKSAISDVFKDRFFDNQATTAITAPMVTPIGIAKGNKKNKKKKNAEGRQNVNKQSHRKTSTPSNECNGTIDQLLNNRSDRLPFTFSLPISGQNNNSMHNIDASSDLMNSTIVERVPIANSQATQSSITTNPTNHGIRVADKRTYLWLSGFHHSSTAQQVASLVSNILKVDENEIICRSLKSSRRSYNDFQHISFRIGLRSSDVKDALHPDKWPVGISCKLFDSKNQKN